MVWYIPHHGVYHPHKQGKIRVVFDCAASYLGVSLNQLLLEWPDLTSSLLNVLMMFRQEQTAVTADVESMFYQVRVSKSDIDCLRFLWWPRGDLSSEPQVYRMLVHLFGAASSPACSNVALQKTGVDNRDRFSSDVCDAMSKNFYVDDFLMSLPTKETAIQMAADITELCSLGGFRLTKWSSSNRDVIKSIPDNERATQLRDFNLDSNKLPEDRTLGVKWYPEIDKFGFTVVEKRLSIVTRRSMLSVVGSVFDPLGFVSPFLLVAKLLLQELCRRSMSWDEALTGEALNEWRRWERELPQLARFTISRCLKPSHLNDIMICQIHHFSDASNLGYGVVSYVRFVDVYGQMHCSLLLSRARVNPLKRTTIPRLELTAATAAVRLHHKVIDRLEYHVSGVFYWTDSMSVLRYIYNQKTRFYTFVANRVSFIRESTDLSQWRFVPTALNPADDVSRGLRVEDLLSSARWQHGPEFLWQDEGDWPDQPAAIPIPVDDPEVRKESNVSVLPETAQIIDRLLSRFSSWLKLKKVVAWLLVAKRCLQSWAEYRKILTKQLQDEEPDQSRRKDLVEFEMKKFKSTAMTESRMKIADTSLSVEILMEAEKVICCLEQNRFFSVEISMISEGRVLPRSSALYRLDPVIKDGLLRVGGRLDKADLPFEVRHPIIMPARSPVSRLILSSAHNMVGHLGRNSILAEVRQRFWIIHASSLIKELVRKCVVCRRYQARCLDQKMADLPVDRTIAGNPPFTRVGMDYFGPIEVKRGRSVTKRYGVVFTCLSSRAIHLEVAQSLETDSCINAIRRFSARRGPVRVIRSDNGTNLVGAKRELREELLKCDGTKIRNSLLEKEIDWQFNPPTASHFGGVWERMIRTVRKVLFSLMRQQTVNLDDESLATLFCEVEAIVNSRPITKASNDPADLDVLTPNHLLLLRGGHLSFGVSDPADIYSRRRWKQVQFLADMFWTRWSKEYLVALQERQKWVKPRVNISVGDVVLLADNTPRNSWAMGRVIKVEADKKGLVRVAHVKTRTSVLCRPIHKLCLILESESTVLAADSTND
jgi:hypothetical protein